MANEFKARFLSGIQGPPGPWFTPTVSEGGTLSWTNNGGFPNPPDVFLGLHDGSVTDAKLADDLKLDKKTLFLGQGSDLDLEDHCIMYLSDPGYTSVQGICAIDDSHIVVGRYKSGDVRDLMVYDLDTRRVVASNVFDPDGDDATRKVALGHLNNLSYSDGYIYCGRVEPSSSAYYRMDRIFKLAVDPNTYSITYADEYELSFTTICWEGDYCYWFSGGSATSRHIFKRRTISGETEDLFETDWPARVGIGKFSPQGLHMDEDFVYRAASGAPDVESLPGGQTDYQRHTRSTEKIIIMRRSDGAIVRTLTFPRSSCGEVEDLTTVTKNGSKYLLISTNSNNYGVACVYAIPFTASDTSTVTFERSRTGKGLINYGSRTDALNGYRVYCDNSACYSNGVYDPLNANPFATGLTQDRFTSFYAALLFCQRAGGPVHLYLTGTYAETLYVRGINGIHFILNGAIINTLDVRETSMYLSAMSGQTNKIGQLYVELASIVSNAGSALTFDQSLGSPTWAICCYRSIIVGGFGAFTGYSTLVRTLQGFLSISSMALDSDSSYLKPVGNNGFVVVNGRPEMLGNNYSTSATLTLSGKSASHTIQKYEKTVSFGIALGDGTAFSSATGDDSLGTIPAEYRPAATVLAAGIVSTESNGAGTATAVTIRITTAGAISLIGNAEAIQAAKYLYASIAYLTT